MSAGFGPSVGLQFPHGAWWSGNFLRLADLAVVGGMSISTSHDGLLDIDGLAERLGVGERFVRRLVEERRIPYLKIGRLVRFDTDDHQTDPRGLVAFNGLKATLTGEEPESLGKATIQ